MAEYRNEKNQVTIDRAVLEEDEKKIKKVIISLNLANDDIERTIKSARDNSTLAGDYFDAIVYKSNSLKKEIDEEIKRLTELVKFIDNTIAKYEALDKKVKSSLESSKK